MSLGELTKCLKELDVYPALLSRAELMIAFRACASRAVNAKALVVQQFAACMARVALFATSHQSMRYSSSYPALPQSSPFVLWCVVLHCPEVPLRRSSWVIVCAPCFGSCSCTITRRSSGGCGTWTGILQPRRLGADEGHSRRR